MEMLELLPERLGTTGSEDDAKLKQKNVAFHIIEACMEYKNDCWVGYDCCFRHQAASQSWKPWSTVDTTLWNLAFAGHARTARCKHCFSLAHQSGDCDLSLELPNT